MSVRLRQKVLPFWQRTKRESRLALALGLAHVGWCSKPSFLIVGAQKAGTVALFRYLSYHPDLVPAKSKEIRFFNSDRFYRRGEAWYHAHFPITGGRRPVVTYEATPEYLYDPRCAERIYAYNAALKLIVLLREPVERAFSAWNMYRHMVQEQPRYLHARSRLANDAVRQAVDDMLARERFPDFAEVVRHEIESLSSVGSRLEPGCVGRGLYAEQLGRYFEYFPREQIWIGDSHLLRTDTSAVLDGIVRFLGLPQHDWGEESFPEHHVGEYKDRQIPEQTRVLLQEFYAVPNRELFEMLGKDFGWA